MSLEFACWLREATWLAFEATSSTSLDSSTAVAPALCTCLACALAPLAIPLIACASWDIADRVDWAEVLVSCAPMAMP